MSDPLYSLRQVADFTGTPIDTVRRWVLEGRIEVERVGPLRLKRVRVKQSVLVSDLPECPEVTQSAGQLIAFRVVPFYSFFSAVRFPLPTQ
jgi:excisionase family DNA binding protein